MSETNLEKRVEALEHEVHLMKSLFHNLEQRGENPWWISQAGMFKDDPLFDEMVEISRQYRKSQTDSSK
jgi:hypothetical protein